MGIAGSARDDQMSEEDDSSEKDGQDDRWLVVGDQRASDPPEWQPAIPMATMDDGNEQCHWRPHPARRCPEAPIMCRIL